MPRLEDAKRVLICGSRDYINRIKLVNIISNLAPSVIIIEGGARGADKLARAVAENQGFTVEEFPADWNRYGRAAGPIRNKQMLTEGKPDLVLAFYSSKEKSRGTKNMVEQAQKANVRTIEYVE